MVLLTMRGVTSYLRNARIQSISGACHSLTKSVASITGVYVGKNAQTQLAVTRPLLQWHYRWILDDDGKMATNRRFLSQNMNFRKKRTRPGDKRFKYDWEQMLREFIEYRKEHDGDALVPSDYQPNPKLGKWVETVRRNYRKYNLGKNSILDGHRIQLLDEAGFVWNINDEIWNKRYKELLRYREKHGNLSIPQTEEFKELWSWIFKQRRNYVKKLQGDVNSLDDRRIMLLNNIGFIFDQHEVNWNLRFEDLKEYKRNHGDCLVSKKHSNMKLVKWVEMQRMQYKNRQIGELSYLSPKRLKKLKSIGFVWNVYDFKWNKRCEELKVFVTVNGHCKIPAIGNHKPLNHWVNRQRNEYKKFIEGEKSQLDDSRVELLRKAGLNIS